MHLRITIVALTLGVLLPAGFCMAFDEANARTLFEKKCTQCHGIQDYDLGNRSLKEWQLVVERMSSYGGSADPYTDDEADEIVAFLYLGKHDPKPPGYMYEYEKPVVSPAESQPTTAAASALVVPKPKDRVSWRKSKATGVAKFMGYAATALMVLMVASGLARKRLRLNFSSLHVVMAICLFGALSIHVSVYLCEYGAPGVLWLWFGILASVLVGLVEFGGLMRARLGGRFIRLHSICGGAGLLLVLLHWFWIYV